MAWVLGSLISALFNARREAQNNEAIVDQLQTLASASAPVTFGKARLGNADDLRKAALLEQERGWICGHSDEGPVRYAGEGHIAVVAPTGAGKGVEQILPNVGLIDDHSLVILDPKNGDTTWSCWERRKRLNPGRTFAFNPYGRFGIGSVGINPLDRVVAKLKAGVGYLGAAHANAAALVPIPPDAREPWPQVGAQELIEIAILHLAHTDAEHCSLPAVYERLVRSKEDVIKYLEAVAASSTPGGIPQRAAGVASMIADSGGQWAAIAQEVRNGLAFVAPGEVATACMRRTTFDIARFKQEPCYLAMISPADELSGFAGKIQQIVLDHLLDTLAAADGPVRTTFVLDEFQNFGTSAQLPKSLNMYRSQGIQLVFFIHDFEQLGAKYTPAFAKAIYSACTVRLLWSMEDEELLRKLEFLSGKTTVRTVSYNSSPGPSGSAGYSITEQARPLLQVEQLRLMDRGLLLMHMRDQPMFFLRREPYYNIIETHSLRDPRAVRSDSVLEARSDCAIGEAPHDDGTA